MGPERLFIYGGLTAAIRYLTNCVSLDDAPASFPCAAVEMSQQEASQLVNFVSWAFSSEKFSRLQIFGFCSNAREMPAFYFVKVSSGIKLIEFEDLEASTDVARPGEFFEACTDASYSLLKLH